MPKEGERMKSSIMITPNENYPEYPRLMKGKEDDDVVLFSSYENGTVIHSGTMEYPVGFHQTDWDMDSFITFIGSVILES
jgi:hypothetical protein